MGRRSAPGRPRRPGRRAPRPRSAWAPALRPLRTLRTLAPLLVALAALGVAVRAQAAAVGNVATDAGLRGPRQLTAADSDQLLGVPIPGESRFVFLSTRDAVAAAYVAPLRGGAATPLFDEGADLSLLRPSPDGRSLVYLSSRDDATFDVCVRAWPSLEQRRCLGDGRTAESFAFFYPDGRSLGVVARAGMHGELQLRRVPIDGSVRVADAEVVVERSVATPALSPDGRWLAYVPIERANPLVGVHFSMQLGRGLHLLRLGSGKQALRVVVPMPGVTGFPAFSLDGRWLYFVQAPLDSNGDGTIDGDDRSVVMRAPFDATAATPLQAREAEVLTSPAWSCRYPAPGAQELLLTCERNGRLEVFSLPLDGAVPASWSESRLRAAVDAADVDADRLLLLWRLARRAPSPAAALEPALEALRLYLRRGDTPAAIHAAGALAQDAEQIGPAGQRVRAVAQLLAALAAHRRDTARLEAGARDGTYVEAQAALRAAVERLAGEGDSAVAAVAALVLAEIADALGREDDAIAALSRVRPQELRDAGVLRLVGELGVARLRALERWDDALAWLAALAQHPSLDAGDRCGAADAYVGLLLRGRPFAARAALIATARASVGEGSALAYRLDVERALPPRGAAPSPAAIDAARTALFALFRADRAMEARRALVRAVLARAAALDDPELLYVFANAWIDFVPRDHPGRAAALAVFRQVMLERGWIAWNAGAMGEARGNFFSLSLLDDDMEAHLGFAMARLVELERGRPALSAAAAEAKLVAEVAKRQGPTSPPTRMVRALVAQRVFARASGHDERMAALDTMDAELDAALGERPSSHHLLQWRGWASLQRFLAGQGRSLAVQAHDYLLLATALAPGDGRLAGMSRHAKALLQAAVGNHRIALDAARARAQAPLTDARVRLHLALLHAQSAWHAGELAEARTHDEAAVAMCRSDATLGRYLAVALDRAAVHALDVGDFGRAAAHAAALWARPEVSGANRVRAALLWAAAALAQGDTAAALRALDQADGALADASDEDLTQGRAPWAAPWQADRARLRAIADGLRGRAALAAGEPARALAAFERRLAALEPADDQDPVRLQRAATQWHRAVALGGLGRREDAMRAVGAGLEDVSRFAQATGTAAPAEQVWLLEAAAELHLAAGAPLAALGRPLVAEIDQALAALTRHGHPRWRAARERLLLYATALELRRGLPR